MIKPIDPLKPFVKRGMVALRVHKGSQTSGDFVITLGPTDTLDTRKFIVIGMVCHLNSPSLV